MPKLKIVAIALMAIALTAGPAAANFREIHVQYFTDSQLDNMVGETVDDCDDSFSSWGNITADYIGHFEVSCSTGEVSNVTCYHWNGSYYESVTCYYDEPMCCYGRLRIPVG